MQPRKDKIEEKRIYWEKRLVFEEHGSEESIEMLTQESDCCIARAMKSLEKKQDQENKIYCQSTWRKDQSHSRAQD